MSNSMTTTVEATSNRRQPIRATRINSTRTLDSVRDEVEEEAKPEFLPGITHFTDTLAALPKEMVRHSTMLKETDAKLYAPEQDLRMFLLTQPPPYTQSELGADNPTLRYHENACNIMASMLGSLDEKNHVLSTANEALDKLLARCESAWPLIEQEISEDTRRGRLDHWAYTDRSADKKPITNPERSSRRNLDSEKTAALIVADVLNSKSSKGHKRTGHDATDAEDPRKGNQNKRKTHDANTGLGLSIGNAAVKRRKVEKPIGLTVNGGHIMEKSLSSVFRNTPGSPTVSTADGKKKGKNVNSATNGRRRAGTAASNTGSPSMISSPVLGAFAIPGKGGNSPKMSTSMARTTSSRARGGPTSNPGLSHRPGSAASTPLMNGLSYPDEKPSMSRTSSSYRMEDHGNGDIDGRSSYRTGMKREESNNRPRPPSISTATRNNGKVSKNGTPVIGSFPDTSRPRSGRNSTTTINAMEFNPPKRSHKKKDPAALQRQRSHQKAGGTRMREDGDSDEMDDVGEAEQLYCYCNGPSHGEMVACDMPGCEKEWFHLECVGLTKPPPNKSKWFCPDCRPKQQRLAMERVAAV